MKKFFSSIVVVLLLVYPFSSRAHAAATAPTTPVWFTPVNAKPGDTVDLHAFIYNPTAATASLTVAFSEGNVTIATATPTDVAPHTGKDIATSFALPTGRVVITAEVTRALSGKKEVPSLEGVIGTVTVGDTTPSLTFPDTTVLKQWGQSFLNLFEVYRLKEAAYFTDLKDRTKNTLPNAPTTSGGTLLNPSTTTSAPSVHTSSYIVYAYASVGKVFFVQKVVYYVSIILAVLLISRFILLQIF